MAKLTIIRNKKFPCSMIPFYIYLNGNMKGEVRNGKEVTIDVDSGDYELLITKLKIVQGRATNSGYGGVLGSIVEESNKSKELNKAHIHIDNQLIVECESNMVDCQIINIK